jgi:hypothetical protein
MHLNAVLGERPVEDLSGIKEEVGVFFSVKGKRSIQ